MLRCFFPLFVLTSLTCGQSLTESACVSVQSYATTPDSMRITLANTCENGAYLNIHVLNSRNDTVAYGRNCACQNFLPMNTPLIRSFRLNSNVEVTDTLFIAARNTTEIAGGTRTSFLSSRITSIVRHDFRIGPIVTPQSTGGTVLIPWNGAHYRVNGKFFRQ
jgi:hypothetical protein